MQQSALIIGTGIGGLASAIRLAVKGYAVDVFEQSALPGGKISQRQSSGFRFDTGPSLFTMPQLVDELFQLAGKKPDSYFRYSPLDSSCKYFWEDGTHITAWKDPEKFASEIAANTSVKAEQVLAFLKKSQRLYDITHEVFLFSSFHKPANYLKPAFRKSLFRLHELDAFTTMHRKNSRWFSDHKVIQLFDRYATYNGSSPYKTPATLNIIPHLEHNIGAFFPEKGMYHIVDALYRLSLDLGVRFHFETPVKAIHTKGGRVVRVETSKTTMTPDIVISNVDIIKLYGGLLPGQSVPKKQLSRERSSSALIFYWGIDRVFDKLSLHNIFFSKNYKAEFDHLFEKKSISDDPTVYIFISCKQIPEDAPPGFENWYVMINAPENIGQDWNSLIAAARFNILKKIHRITGVDIASHIVTESMADPRSIEAETASFRGSLYGLSSNSSFSAFNRHPNFKKSIKNLYFTGGSVHPGGGIPLCLASARIVDEAIQPDPIKH